MCFFLLPLSGRHRQQLKRVSEKVIQLRIDDTKINIRHITKSEFATDNKDFFIQTNMLGASMRQHKHRKREISNQELCLTSNGAI